METIVNNEIDPIVFNLDISGVEQGTKKANTAIEGYRGKALEASKDIGDSFQRTAALAVRSADSSFEKVTRDMQRLGDGAERMGKGIEGAFRGMGHAVRGTVEYDAAIGASTIALEKHTEATRRYEAVVGSLRALRVGLATAFEGTGSGLAVVGGIAGFAAVEESARLTYRRAQELQRQAVQSAKSGLSYTDTVSLNYETQRTGLPADFYNGAIKTAGGVDQLAQKLKELGEVRDPIDQARQAFALFGKDAEKLMPHLNEQFDEGIKKSREWGLALSQSSRENITQFKKDVDDLKGWIGKSFFPDFNISLQAAGNQIASGMAFVWKTLFSEALEVNKEVYGAYVGYLGKLSPKELGKGSRDTTEGMQAAPARTGLPPTRLSPGPELATYDREAAAGEKYFASNKVDREAELRSRVKSLESQLIVTDRTSPEYGKPVAAANYPGGFSARALAMQSYAGGQRELADIQKQKDADAERAKSLKEIAAAQKEVDSIVRSSQLSELSGMDKLNAERAIAMEQYGKTKELQKEIAGAFNIRFAAENKSLRAEEIAKLVVENDAISKAAVSIMNARNSAQTSTFGEAYKLNAQGGAKRSDIALQQLGIQRDAQLGAAETDIAGSFDPNNLRGRNEERSLSQKVALEQRKFQIESDYLTKSRDLQAAGIAGDRDAAIASYKVLLDTKLINDNAFQAVRKNIEINADLDLKKLSEKTDADIAAASNQAAIAAAKLMGEEYRREFETIQQSAEGLFHTLFTKPAQFGKQLGDTLREAMLKPVIDGMSKMTANVLQPVIYGSDGQGGISGMFKGMFGGKSENPLVGLTQQSNVYLATIVAMMASSVGIAAPSVPGGPTVSVPTPSAIYRSRGGIGIPGFGGIPSTLASIAPFLQPMQSVSGGGGSGPAPAGSVSSTIDYGNGPVSLGGSYYPGGSFNAAVGGGGFSGGGAPGAFGLGIVPGGGTGPAGGIAKIFNAAASGKLGGGPGGFGLSNVKAMGSNLGKAIGYQGDGVWKTQSGSLYSGSDFGTIAGSIARSPAAGAAGMTLAQSGIFGNSRGTWTGIAEGTAGGALIGEQYGGPLGAAVGAAVGFGVTLGEKVAGVMSPVNEAKKDVKQAYGINIDNKTANQIAQLAKDKYAGHIGIAVRSPEVRQMLQLYSAGTGQKFPLSASTPRAGSLAEQNGGLYQMATTQFGTPYTYQSNLPVLGPQGAATWPGGGGPTYLSLHVDGSSTADFMKGQIATTVNPSFVQDQYSGALNASNGRLNNSAMIQQPGLIVS